MTLEALNGVSSYEPRSCKHSDHDLLRDSNLNTLLASSQQNLPENKYSSYGDGILVINDDWLVSKRLNNQQQ